MGGHQRPSPEWGEQGPCENCNWPRKSRQDGAAEMGQGHRECGLCPKTNGKSLTWVMNQESHVVRFNRDYLGSRVGEWIGEAGSVAV